MPWDSLPCTAAFDSSPSCVSLEVLMGNAVAFGAEFRASRGSFKPTDLYRLIAVYVWSCYFLPLIADVASGAGSVPSQWVPDFEPWRNRMGTKCV